MKVNGNGRAKVLTTSEIEKLFSEGLTSPRDRAIFAVCLFTGCRVSEALALRVSDIKGDTITFRKSTTKGKLRTRSIKISPKLRSHLDDYQSPRPPALFPGMRGIRETLSRDTAHDILNRACDRVGLEGVSTHSFRRTALTRMHNNGVPLSVIQEISGHHSLDVLSRYLEISEEQLISAVAVI